MELSSWIRIIKDCSVKMHEYILKKLHKKIVDLDEYSNEEFEVGNNYPNISPQCIEETNKGAKFYWSKIMNPGYEKYFEVVGNKRRYFTWGGQYLWIKK